MDHEGADAATCAVLPRRRPARQAPTSGGRAGDYGDDVDAAPPLPLGAELQHLVLEPMIRAPLAAPTPPHKEGEPEPLPAGVAIWAKVSEEVDKKIREQIKAGAFPVRLKAEEWDSGDIAWLLDAIAQTKEQASAVVKNFGQVVKDGKLFVHPGVRNISPAYNRTPFEGE